MKAILKNTPLVCFSFLISLAVGVALSITFDAGAINLHGASPDSGADGLLTCGSADSLTIDGVEDFVFGCDATPSITVDDTLEITTTGASQWLALKSDDSDIYYDAGSGSHIFQNNAGNLLTISNSAGASTSITNNDSGTFNLVTGGASGMSIGGGVGQIDYTYSGGNVYLRQFHGGASYPHWRSPVAATGIEAAFKFNTDYNLTTTAHTVWKDNNDSNTLMTLDGGGHLTTTLAIQPVNIAGTAPAATETCVAGLIGSIISVNDTDDGAISYMCYCAQNADDSTYSWLKIDGGAACFP